MNEEEKWLFDLKGYLVLENVIDAPTLARMNAWLDAQAERDPEAWGGGTNNAHKESPITWGPDFLALLDHAEVLPRLKEILGDTVRLDHDYGIFLQPGHTGLEIHGPSMRQPYDPIHFYQYVDGRIFSGLAVVGFALTDVPEGAGGLCVVEGSHKSHFPIPNDIRKYQRPHSVVKQIPTKAGSCVIFTERLWHGTLPWQGPGTRRTLFYKYAPGGIAWDRTAYQPQLPREGAERLPAELTPEQRRLLYTVCADDFRRKL